MLAELVFQILVHRLSPLPCKTLARRPTERLAHISAERMIAEMNRTQVLLAVQLDRSDRGVPSLRRGLGSVNI